MIRQFVIAALVSTVAVPALANPCAFEENGRMVVVGYAVGATAIPSDQKSKLAKFAETAKFRDGVCIFAQVDKQGSDEANKKVADKRATAVRKFLLSKGVPDNAIKIATQDKAFTLFGLLSSDQQNDRRVKVTYN
jgi:outer membrane protein OmpA-like peptidoglycan-associated protein